MLTISKASRQYDNVTILLHWLKVALVLSRWLGAHAIDWFHTGWPRTDIRSLHIVIGLFFTGVIMVRLVWRWTRGTQFPPADSGALQFFDALLHGLFYLLVVTTVALGLLNAFARGDNLFGLFSLPKLLFDSPTKAQINGLHGLFANVILAAASAHAAAALRHQYLLKDGVLTRMIPARAHGPLNGKRDRW